MRGLLVDFNQIGNYLCKLSVCLPRKYIYGFSMACVYVKVLLRC